MHLSGRHFVPNTVIYNICSKWINKIICYPVDRQELHGAAWKSHIKSITSAHVHTIDRQICITQCFWLPLAPSLTCAICAWWSPGCLSVSHTHWLLRFLQLGVASLSICRLPEEMGSLVSHCYCNIKAEKEFSSERIPQGIRFCKVPGDSHIYLVKTTCQSMEWAFLNCLAILNSPSKWSCQPCLFNLFI